MKTKESAQLDQLVLQGKVEWAFTDHRGTGWHNRSDFPPRARCTVVASGALLVSLMHRPGQGYEITGSDIVTGKELREIPMPEYPELVEVPLHYLDALEDLA